MTTEVPWFSVFGFGGHIKATARDLVVMQGGTTRRYPLSGIGHLLVVGGHFLHTSAVINLLKNGSAISFFDIDGTPVGYLHPYGYRMEEEVRTAQERAAPYRYAQATAIAAVRSRLLFLEHAAAEAGQELFYEGELELLHQARDELEHLITMDELRRLHRLTADMYYEIVARIIPPELGYRRRTDRPYRDPVNAMFSLGYAMLYGNCCVAIVGAHLDPDAGMLHEGAGSLVYDLIEPQKAGMVDSVVVRFAREVSKHEYECSGARCYLSDDLSGRLTRAFQATIDQSRLDAQVGLLRDSLLQNSEYHVLY